MPQPGPVRIVLCAAVLVVSACILTSSPPVLAVDTTPSPEHPVALRVGWTTDPASMNPFVGQEGASWEIYSLNYDYLTGLDAATLTPRPQLATSWRHSKDGTVWTFHLRRDVKWQDGRPFTSADVVFTFDYIIRNDMGAFMSYMTFISKVVAVDRYTVRVLCSQPKANMLSLTVPILPRHIWSKVDPEVAQSTFDNDPPVIGTGPFQVVEYRTGRWVRMVANKSYWGGSPKVDEVIFQIYQSDQNMLQELRSGAIQAARDLPLASVPTLQSDQTLDVATSDANRLVHDLGFNCYTGRASKGNRVLLDPDFRRALNYAIDKATICKVAYFGLAKPAETVILSDYFRDPDWHWEPPQAAKYEFDLDRARAALDEAGYRDADGDGVREWQGKPIVLRLWAIRDEPDRVRVGRLVAGWFEQIGLRIKYEILDEGILVDRMWDTEGEAFAPDYDMFLWGWNSEVDPNSLLSYFTTGQIGSWSDTNWSNAEYDRLYAQQQSTLDADERKAIIDRMQALMYRETPMIFFAEPATVTAWNVSEWEGWVRSPAGDGQPMGVYPVEDTYVTVHPRSATGGSGSGEPPRGTLLAVGTVAVAALAIVVVTTRRRRSGAAKRSERD
jgi:peptide/nickel transport system substrate-binding protein